MKPEKAKSEGVEEKAITEQLFTKIEAARLQSTSKPEHDVLKAQQTVKSQVSVPHNDHHKNAKPPKTFKSCNARFQYGNYTKYYGYRNPQKFQDDRMNFLKKEWFKGEKSLENAKILYADSVICSSAPYDKLNADL